MKRIALGVVLAWSSGVTMAGADYRCTVERIHMADEDSSSLIKAKRQMYAGKEFTVDRRTGTMAGALKNAYMTEPVVIDQGSSENAFKAVTTMTLDQGAGAGTSVFVIVVQEYEESERKPFLFVSDDTAYFGGCVHF